MNEFLKALSALELGVVVFGAVGVPLPRATEPSVGPVSRVERPTRHVAYPHLSLQLDLPGVFIARSAALLS